MRIEGENEACRAQNRKRTPRPRERKREGSAVGMEFVHSGNWTEIRMARTERIPSEAREVGLHRVMSDLQGPGESLHSTFSEMGSLKDLEQKNIMIKFIF